MLYCLEPKCGINVFEGESNQTFYPFFSFFLTAIFNVDDSVVDLETLAALYENVSIKDIQN